MCRVNIISTPQTSQGENTYTTRVVVLAQVPSGTNIEIIFDSGANYHVFKDISLFNNIRKG